MGLAAGHEAWILTVGNEVLIGKIVNTNAAWLGRKLTLLGYKVRREIVVADELEDIAWGFKTALKEGARVIVSTGGLGPTFDDKTSEGLALALKKELEVNEEALSMIKKKYEEKGMSLTEHRIKMAKLPKGAKPIPNPVGTAPGIHIKVGRCEIFSLPGVPSEMRSMFEGYVEPYLRRLMPNVVFIERVLRVYGVPESEIAPIVEKAMKVGKRVYIKSHPKGAELGGPFLELHITASGSKEEEAKKELNNVTLKLIDELKNKNIKIFIKE